MIVVPNERKFLLIVENNKQGSTWVEIEVDEFQSCLDHPAYYDFFTFSGHFVTICVVVWNKCANRQIALKVATAFVEGAYRTLHLNPEDNITYCTNGEPYLRNPPY